MKRKTTWILVLCLAATAMLAGCANTNNPSPSPSMTPSMMPSATISPMPTTSPMTTMPSTSPSTSGTPSADAGVDKQASTAIQAEVDKLSEVDKSYVVVIGDQALVGVQFTAQYQGGMTDRIREMVEEKAMSAQNTIKTTVITDDPEQVTKIEDMVKNAGEGVKEEFQNLLNAINKA